MHVYLKEKGVACLWQRVSVESVRQLLQSADSGGKKNTCSILFTAVVRDVGSNKTPRATSSPPPLQSGREFQLTAPLMICCLESTCAGGFSDSN